MRSLALEFGSLRLDAFTFRRTDIPVSAANDRETKTTLVEDQSA